MGELKSIARLVRKHADLPMSLPDACLARVAECHPGAAVFAVDGHFRIYRKQGRRVIPTVMPAGR